MKRLSRVTTLVTSLTSSIILALLSTPQARTATDPSHTVNLVQDGISSTFLTRAQTVGEFLEEHDIAFHNGDFLSVPVSGSLSDSMTIAYRPASTYHLLVDRRKMNVSSAGATVSAVLRSAHIRMGEHDTVTPDIDAPPDPATPIRVIHASRFLRKYAHLARFTHDSLATSARIAGYAMRMIATAYTAQCAGCSGVTRSGMRAGFGIVAVDPRVIPLGSSLYISGYGRAVAGDTGGAILGHRIDLGFERRAEALQFGRRAVNVYVLRK